MGESITRAERILKGMNLPPQYTYVFTGQAKTLGETGYYFLIAFALSITFMYLILAAQFESWMQPIAILMALPVTIPFGMLSLVLVPHADGPLRDVRPVHAGGHRQEERHPCRSTPPTSSGPRGWRGTTRSSRPTTRGCGRS